MANSHSLSFAHRLIVSVSLVCIFPKMTMGLVGNVLNVGYKLLFKQQTVLVTTFDVSGLKYKVVAASSAF
jgi:hypothetical protein